MFYLFSKMNDLLDWLVGIFLGQNLAGPQAPTCETKTCMFDPKKVLYEGKEYPSIREAARATGVSRYKIRKGGVILD